jgi:DnaK suppressor protein
MTGRKDINIDALRKSLVAKIKELEEMSEKTSESRDAVELDQTRQGRLSRQDALLQQEMAKETERRRKVQIEKMKQALLRMETEDFGFCVICDEEIAVKRIELDPSILTCITCAKGA